MAPSKLRPGHVLFRQEQILRAGLGKGVLASVSRLDDRREGGRRGEVNDVEGRLGHLRQADGPGGGLALHLGWPGEPVEDRIGLAAGESRGDYGVDGDAVLGVDHDEGAVAGVPASIAWRMSLSVA